jgi:hypothetical protein
MAIKRVILQATGAAILAASIALAGSAPASASTPAGPAAASDSTSPTVYAYGTVQSGVEGGCLILVTGWGLSYNLLGGDRTVLRPGARVLVAGTIPSGIATACMQGYPLLVKSATPF